MWYDLRGDRTCSVVGKASTGLRFRAILYNAMGCGVLYGLCEGWSVLYKTDASGH